MKVLVLGSGMMGAEIAHDMCDSNDVSEVIVADLDKKRTDGVVARLKRNKVSGKRLDVKDVQATKKLMKGFDVAVCALPDGLNTFASKAAIGTKVHLVDLAYGHRQLEFDGPAKKAGITIVPDCGVAPGLTNILAAHGASLMDEVDDIRIVCGGLPQKPLPPLGYRITWSTWGLINMYCGKARIVRDGKIVEVDAMSDLERIEFPGLGELEAFTTDGLSTLLVTMKGKVRTMVEKTARYPGHAEKIMTMRDLGLFDTNPVDVGGVKVVPRNMAVSVLNKTLRRGDERDVTVLRVDVAGKKDGNDVERSFVMVDRFDEERGVTSMARTTGYTAAIVARMVARGDIGERGVVPPETAVGKVFKRFVSELEDREVRIQETSRIKN
ncbi:MAG: saccharopine dehydrogenase family protein [Candidatus Thermoplasmatota archaeon]|nr:saccharopine dehydrogenase family protein [Candidatus Thermoplasmatota archaeon]